MTTWIAKGHNDDMTSIQHMDSPTSPIPSSPLNAATSVTSHSGYEDGLKRASSSQVSTSSASHDTTSHPVAKPAVWISPSVIPQPHSPILDKRKMVRRMSDPILLNAASHVKARKRAGSLPLPANCENEQMFLQGSPSRTAHSRSGAFHEEKNDVLGLSMASPITSASHSEASTSQQLQTSAETIVQCEQDATAEVLQWANRPPTPPRRNLRTRKAAQLAPYTTEMQRYKRRLLRNDWEDAVVVEREFLRAQREKRKEREREGIASDVENEVDVQSKRSKGKDRHAIDTLKSLQEGSTRGTPLQERESRLKVMSRYGGLLSSSSESEDQPRLIGRASRERSVSVSTPSTSSQDAALSSRKRYRRAIPSESESSSVEIMNHIHHISGDESNGAITITDEDEERDGKGDVQRHDMLKSLSAKEMRYYKQQLKLLKHTMPMSAAKRHIEDLIAMHREAKEGVGQSSDSDDYQGVVERDSHLMESLRPGESRTRIAANRDKGDGRLIDDADEESDDSRMPSPVSSDSEIEVVEVDESVSRRDEEESDKEYWMYSTGRAERDYIDRMLTSAAYGSNKSRKKKANGLGLTRRRRLVLPNNEKSNTIQKSTKRETSQKKRRTNTTYSKTYMRPSVKQRILENPPIAEVRNKPRYSLLHDNSLFDRFPMSTIPDEDNQRNPASAMMTPARIAADSSGNLHNSWNGRGSYPSSVSRLDTPSKSASYTPEKSSRMEPLGHRVSPDITDQALPARQGASSKFIQKRLEVKPRPVEASPAHLIKQKLSMDIWQDVSNLRLEFGLKPPPLGLDFRKDTFLGRGRLFELIQLAKGINNTASPQETNVFGFNLTASSFNSRQMMDLYDVARQEMETCLPSDDESETYKIMECSLYDLFRFVSAWISTSSAEKIELERVADLSCENIESLLLFIRGSKGSCYSALLQSLRWYKVEILWRRGFLLSNNTEESLVQLQVDKGEWQDTFVQACQDLMLELLVYGLHHPMRSVKEASQRIASTVDNTDVVEMTLCDSDLTDQSAQYWIGLLHLLSIEASLQLFGPFPSFWNIYEVATKQYQAALLLYKNELIVAENGWYCIMAICTLAYFSASTGVSTSRSCLKGGHWPLILQNLSRVRFRVEEQVEASMPRAALHTRDRYIRLVLYRVSQLHTIWRWSYESSEATLGKLFTLFDSHKLEDLPTEEDHDFPTFLRLYDESRLYDAIQLEDTSFQIFIKILASAAKDLQSVGGIDGKQGDRNVARLFSRFSPLRTMTFTRDLPPTRIERSALYNHYSIALVYLHFVPASHHQRLLQIQQYLSFSKADDKSQLVCIRAMMYAITVLQHHSLQIHEAMNWFKGAFKMLKTRLEELHRTGATSGNQFKWEREVQAQTTLLIAALRSLQYVIKVEGLDKQKNRHDYPDLLLLDSAWTSTLLESQVALQGTSLTVEVIHLIQAFLARRTSALTRTKKASHKDWQVTHTADSQDSFADLFDDVDFDDALLLNATGYYDVADTSHPSPQQSSEEEKRRLDQEFAQAVHLHISPAIFQMLSNLFHPARVPRFSLARSVTLSNKVTETSLAESIIDIWSNCAWIMVEENNVRQWTYYFSYGAEDPKRLQGEVAKRDVTLRFLVTISSKCLEQESPGLKIYKTHLIDFWNSFMASFTSCNLSSQHLLCNNLRQLEGRRTESGGGLFQQMDWQDVALWTAASFQNHRLALLAVILCNLSKVWHDPELAPRSLPFTVLTSLFVSLRVYLAEDKNGQNEEYVDFCKATLSCCRENINEMLLRGVKAELSKTESVIQSLP